MVRVVVRPYLIFIAALMILGVPISRALADACTTDSAACVDNAAVLFSAASGTLHPDTMTYSPEFNYHSGYPEYYFASPTVSGSVAMMKYVLPTACALSSYHLIFNSATQFDIYLSIDVRSGETWRSVYAPTYLLDPADVYDYAGTVGGDPVDEIQIEFSSSQGINLNTIRFNAADTCAGGGGGTLTRPIYSGDEIETSPLYDQVVIGDLATHNYQDYQFYPVLFRGGLQTVSAWSKAPGAKVHAADTGSIVDVSELKPEDCGLSFVSPSTLDTEDPDVTPFITPFQAAQKQPCLIRKFEWNSDPLPDYGDVAKDEYWLDPTDAYIVTLQIGTGEKIQYLVKNARNYVVVGDVVDVGCVLGETLPMTTIPSRAINFPGIAGTLINIAVGFVAPSFSVVASEVTSATGLGGSFVRDYPATQTDFGYTVMTAYGEDDAIVELASQLTVDPTNDDPCNTTGDYKNCKAYNPQFARGGDRWIASGNVQWDEPGVTLDPGESVYQQVQLISTSDYTATIYAQGVNGQTGQVRMFLGSFTQRVAVGTEWTYIPLAASPLGAPDVGSFYTVGVENTGTTPIQVASLCVSSGAPNVGRNSCYFSNNSFASGTTDWTVTEGVEPVDQALNVPNGGIISQNVKLLPLAGGPATYKLVVRGDWWYTGSLDTVSSASAIAQVQYEYPDGTGYQNMIPVTIKGNLAYGAGQLAYVANITVSSETDDVLNIKVSTTDAGDMGVQGIRITDACLSTIDGGAFPGQGGSGAPPPLNADCTYVSRPQNNDTAAWLQWHWAKSEQFFKCDLMVLLNKMYKLGQQSYTLAGWQARYAQSNLQLWSSWLSKQLFPWLNGQLANLIRGINNTTATTGETINTSASVVTDAIQAAQKISNAIKGVVKLIRSIIEQFLSFFQLLRQLTEVLVGAYNDTAAIPIPYLPQCTLGPDESVICIAIWILDNTVFAGPGAAVIPIVITFGSAHLLIWLAVEIKKLIMQQGQAI